MKAVAKRKPRTKTARKQGDAVRIRMYAVGFGDAFLVLLPGADRPLRVLVDCGSIAKDKLAMDDVVKAIIEDCTDPDGIARIDVVVATHRHRDHVSGFASKRWADVHVGEVWLPWTENPGDAAARRIREEQARLAFDLGRALNLADPETADADELDRYSVMALNAAANQNAMRTLHEGFGGSPARRRFLPETNRFPEHLESSELPGVKAFVLGPSKDEKTIRALDPPRTESFLRLAGAGAEQGESVEVFGPEWRVSEQDYISRWPHLGLVPEDMTRIANLSHDNEGALAVALDKAVNGTSLVLVLSVGTAYLLLPGDAQWGTWERMLADPDARNLLKRTSMLKVGHHGSHNATPRSFVDDVLPKDICAMVSTRKVKKWPEIPRQPLLDALTSKGLQIARSDSRGDAPASVFTVDAKDRYVEALLDIGSAGRSAAGPRATRVTTDRPKAKAAKDARTARKATVKKVVKRKAAASRR
jgi:beta-lactamase superfamily II metal-dependent hydrolase